MPRWIFVFFSALLLFLTDRGIKSLITGANFANELLFDNNLVSIAKVYNTGAAFGILKGMTPFLILFSSVVMIILSVYILKKHKDFTKLQSAGLAMILGGTAGNLYDRFFYGFVIDFIKLDFIDFPVFNTADIFINVGVTLLILALFLSNKEKV